jgi:hypothetical protein
MTVIGFLDGHATGYLHLWLLRANCRNPLGDYIECAIHPPDSIVYLQRTINGDDYVIEQGCDIVGALKQQQACGQQGKANILLTKEVAEGSEVAVQQGLAAGKNNLAHPKLAERRTMTIQIGDADLLVGFPLPDVTHNASAIAVAMNIQDENWHRRQLRSELSRLGGCYAFIMQQGHGVLSFRRHEGRFPEPLRLRPIAC